MHRGFYLKISISFLPVTRHKLEFGACVFLIYYVRLVRICNPCRAQTHFFVTNPRIFCFFLKFFVNETLDSCEIFATDAQMHRWFYLKISVSFLSVTRHKLEFGAWVFLIYYVKLARICNPCRAQTFFSPRIPEFSVFFWSFLWTKTLDSEKCLPQMHRWFYLKILIRSCGKGFRLEFGAWVFLFITWGWRGFVIRAVYKHFFATNARIFSEVFCEQNFGLLRNVCHRCTDDFIWKILLRFLLDRI